MARLPQPGADNGTWGSILNDYLSQVHASDGTLKAGTVQAATLAKDAVTNTAIATNAITTNELAAPGGADGQVLVKDSAVTGGMKWASVTGGGGTVASATPSVEGVVRLAGDLGGTSQAPTVPGLAAKADSATTYTKTQVDTALTAKADAATSYTKTQVDTALAAKQDKSGLATVATTGDYNDLANKPAPGSAAPTATTTTTGTITLAGDLAGAADLPKVAKLNGIAVSGTPAAGRVLKATSPTAASWQDDAVGSGGTGSNGQTMTYIWANDDGTWPSASSVGTLRRPIWCHL